MKNKLLIGEKYFFLIKTNKIDKKTKYLMKLMKLILNLLDRMKSNIETLKKLRKTVIITAEKSFVLDQKTVYANLLQDFIKSVFLTLNVFLERKSFRKKE